MRARAFISNHFFCVCWWLLEVLNHIVILVVEWIWFQNYGCVESCSVCKPACIFSVVLSLQVATSVSDFSRNQKFAWVFFALLTLRHTAAARRSLTAWLVTWWRWFLSTDVFQLNHAISSSFSFCLLSSLGLDFLHQQFLCDVLVVLLKSSLFHFFEVALPGDGFVWHSHDDCHVDQKQKPSESNHNVATS